MFINLFRRQRPALARLARNSNAYRQPMVAAVSSSAVGVSSITSAANTANTANTTNATNTAAAIHYAEHHALVPTVLHHSHYHSGNHLSWTNYSTNHPDYQHDEHDEHYD